jgi:hypothetical protein
MAKFDGTLTLANTQRKALYGEIEAFRGEVIHQQLVSSPFLKAMMGETILKTELFDSATNPGTKVEMKVRRPVKGYGVGEESTKWHFQWGASTSAAALTDASALAVATVAQSDNVRTARFDNALTFDRLYWNEIEDFYEQNREARGTANTNIIDINLKAMGEGFRNRINAQFFPINTGAVAAPVGSTSYFPVEYTISDGLNQAGRAAYYASLGLADDWTGSTSDHTSYATYGVNRAPAGNERMRGLVRRIANPAALTDDLVVGTADILGDRGANRKTQVLWLGTNLFNTYSAANRSTRQIQITEEQQEAIKHYGIGQYFIVGGEGGVLVARDPNIRPNTGYLIDHSTMAFGWNKVTQRVRSDDSRNYAEFLQVVYSGQLVCIRPSVNSIIQIF